MSRNKQSRGGSTLSLARSVIKTEAREVAALSRLINSDFEKAVKIVLRASGRVIVTGMGKSGSIAKKISATLASTGTPSLFVHPGEATHGDLGMITRKDVVLAISYSGETEEVLRLLPYLQNKKINLIAFTGRNDSTLANNADACINVSVKKEACPHQLAPTSSTTATLVMGDALAVVLMKKRGFRQEDFAELHPGGSLGKRLLTKVSQVMTKGKLPLVSPQATMSKVIPLMSSGRLGMAIVVKNGKLQGLISDGDLRRGIQKYGDRYFKLKAGKVMTANPKRIGSDASVNEAESLCNKHKITSLIVVNKNKIVGVFQIYTAAKV